MAQSADNNAVTMNQSLFKLRKIANLLYEIGFQNKINRFKKSYR